MKSEKLTFDIRDGFRSKIWKKNRFSICITHRHTFSNNTFTNWYTRKRSLYSGPGGNVYLFFSMWTDFHKNLARSSRHRLFLDWVQDWSARTVILPTDWPAIRVFYHGLLSTQNALLVATRVNINSSNRYGNSFNENYNRTAILFFVFHRFDFYSCYKIEFREIIYCIE